MALTVVYALQPFPTSCKKSIFLAGPTPRGGNPPSWRPDAIALLEEMGFDGHVFVPETSDGQWKHDYDNQVEWEDEGLNRADVILFWVPRTIDLMPAFTTNVEFGEWFKSGKCIFGAPPEAAKVRYLQHKAEEAGVFMADSLKETVVRAVAKCGAGAARQDGECWVPMHVWEHPTFRSWYAAQRAAGNRLDEAHVYWCSSRLNKAGYPFAFVVHVKVWVTAEGRHKSNEMIVGRPDVATVVVLGPDRGPFDTEVLLVREFRSTAVTADGCVYEPPSGSSPKPHLAFDLMAVEELREETGIEVDPSRLRALGPRQLSATLSTHRAHAFLLRLTERELEGVRSQLGAVHGADAEERIVLELQRLADVMENPNVDWSSLGLILRAAALPPLP